MSEKSTRERMNRSESVAGSNIINLLRTSSQQEKSRDVSSGTTTPNASLARPSLEALLGSLNQHGIAQASAPANIPSSANSLLLQGNASQFLPNRLQSLQSSLTQNQRDLLLLNSLQQNNNSSLFGLSNSLGMLGSASTLGALRLQSSLSPLSGIDAAMMPSLNTPLHQPMISQRINPSFLMANLQHMSSSGKVHTTKRSESFPEKLHRLLMEVELEGLSDIISFTPDGRAFQIHKPKQFFDKIVPRYFNQSHLSSFKRQLNLYGFEALPNGPMKGAYFHQDFQKRRPELCKLIHRRNQKWRTPETKP